MTRSEIEAVLERVRTWPLDRQAYAAFLLLGMKRDGRDALELSPEQMAELKQAEAEADRGEFATDEEMSAIFAKYRAR